MSCYLWKNEKIFVDFCNTILQRHIFAAKLISMKNRDFFLFLQAPQITVLRIIGATFMQKHRCNLHIAVCFISLKARMTTSGLLQL